MKSCRCTWTLPREQSTSSCERSRDEHQVEQGERRDWFQCFIISCCGCSIFGFIAMPLLNFAQLSCCCNTHRRVNTMLA